MVTLENYLKPLKATKKERFEALSFIRGNSSTSQQLFDLAINSSAKRSHIYAAWVWELYVMEDLTRLDGNWTKLIDEISKIQHPSMRRVHSKIIWLYLKDKNRYKTLPKKEKERLINTLLEWILTENKAAPLNFSIRILGLFSKDAPRLRNDLEEILLHSKRTFPKGIYPAIRTVFEN
ncbi:MAG: hypothetical protein CBC08_03135 [Flavobacteriaceae bacterium TMED48]|nr:MAG: hypothetical protein CBC08_03135 [Flavobacteriaceae bacterium TMED48]